MSIISVMTIISHDQLSFNTSEIGFILLVSYISLIPPLSSMKSYLNPARSVCPHDITIISCLVVWNIYFIFFYIYILGMSSSQLTNSIFHRCGEKPPTSIPMKNPHDPIMFQPVKRYIPHEFSWWNRRSWWLPGGKLNGLVFTGKS